MASSLTQVFHGLWQNIDDTVSHLLTTQHPKEQICEQLQWLSNNIDAEWAQLSFGIDNHQHESHERNAELDSDASRQPPCSLGSSSKFSSVSTDETGSLDDDESTGRAEASSSSHSNLSRACGVTFPPRNSLPPLPTRSATSPPSTPSCPSTRSASMPPKLIPSVSEGEATNSTSHINHGETTTLATRPMSISNRSFLQDPPDTSATRTVVRSEHIVATNMTSADLSKDIPGRADAEEYMLGLDSASHGQVSSVPREEHMRLRPRTKPTLHNKAQLTATGKKRALRQNSRSTNKRVKSEQADQKNLSNLVKEMDRISQGVVQPQVVLTRFFTSDRSINEDVAGVFIRLFYTVASPAAVLHLKDACSHVRETSKLAIPKDTDTAAQTIQALDALEHAATTQAMLRRYHLTRLVKHRNEREAQYSSRNTKRQLTRSPLKCGRASTLAISELVAEAYPHLDQPIRQKDAVGTEYEKRHKAVVNMLQAGRNWSIMQEVFSPGILALILTGRDYGVHNSDIERIPAPIFRIFLNILDDLRGDFIRQISKAVSQHLADILYGQDLRWKYMFETKDDEVLRSYALDAPVLVDLCAAE